MSARDRIASTRLYLVCDARPRAFLDAALRGGVDMIQLRDKALADDALVAAAREFRAAADAAGALFILNDRPDLVAACGADGVHVGQDDGSVADARTAVGSATGSWGARRTRPSRAPRPRPTRTSTTSWSAPCTRRRPSRDARPPGSPTSSGRRPTCPSRGSRSAGWTRATWRDVTARGASRIVVVRAIAGAADPEAAARALRELVEGPVGAAQP